LKGALIKTGNFENNGDTVNLFFPQVRKGIYFLTIKAKGETISKKIIKL
jgi:hypothetical protein